MTLFRLPFLIVSGVSKDLKWKKAILGLKGNNVSFFLGRVSKLPRFLLNYKNNLQLNKFQAFDTLELEQVILGQIEKLDFSSCELIHICPLNLDLAQKIINKKVKKATEISLQLHFSLLSTKNYQQWFRILREVDFLFISQEDLRLIDKTTSLEKFRELSRAVKKTLFLTMGKRGALIFEKGKIIEKVKPVGLIRILESTGAGDIFCGSVLANLILSKDSITALRLGVLLSAFDLMDWSSEAIFNFVKKNKKKF